MSPFLSDDWFDRLREEAAELPEVTGASAEVVVVVSDAPTGQVRAHLVVEDGRLVSIDPTTDGDDPLELGCPYELAEAIVRGDTSVSVEFMRGALKVNGDIGALHRILPLTDDQRFVGLLRTLAAQTEF